ncbi:response regulator [Pelagibius marinus]|uniref:response regulator n=1 Tax=Pelagibius marinus TaxID=2762760 RepID=UPI001D040532|nr:response regulator transcription factor [Pelagibius marinus]
MVCALIVDDHPLFCEALSMTLKTAVKVDKVLTAGRLEDAIALLGEATKPDVILLDLNLPGVNGLDGLIRLKRAAPQVPIIVVSSLSENRIITSAIRAGAAGFVPKHSQRDVFTRAFADIWAGKVHLPSDYVAPAEEDGDAPSASEDVIQRLAQLTPQQARILQCICEGKLNKQIAYDLSIAEATVKAHITAIMRKLGVHNRTQAVVMAQNAHFSKLLQDDN